MHLICTLVNDCTVDSIRHFHLKGVYSSKSNIIYNFDILSLNLATLSKHIAFLLCPILSPFI